MTWWQIALLCVAGIVYLIIGGFISGLVYRLIDEYTEDPSLFVIAFWPFAALVLLIAAIFAAAWWVAEWIRDV